MTVRHRTSTLVAFSAIALLLAACAGDDPENGDDAPAETQEADEPTAADDDHEPDDDHDDDDHDDHDDHGEDDGHRSDEGATEQAGPTPRLALTYDGGLLIVDAVTGDVEADLPLDGFNRVSPAGDERHVLVTTDGGWAVLDTGTYSSAHGDHYHYYTAQPALSDVLIAADTPAHVVVNDGLTALFDDGTGEITVISADDWTDIVESGDYTPVAETTTPSPHHGVAVATEDGWIVTSEGDEDGRTGARVLDASGQELDATDQCPGLHGYGVAAGGAVLFGCDDGVIVLHGDHFHKVDSPDATGRIGNAYGHLDSAVVLGDYRADPDGPMASVSLIDTEAETIEVVDVGAEYTSRGLARGDDGEVLVLTTDGLVQVIDTDTGASVAEIEVTAAWEVPDDWQAAQPNIEVLDGMLYVTEPGDDGAVLHIVDYAGGEVWRSIELPEVPLEIAGVLG